MTPPHLPEWLKQRDGETVDEWRVRQQRSCFFCPAGPFKDGWAATRHENQCDHNPHARKPGR